MPFLLSISTEFPRKGARASKTRAERRDALLGGKATRRSSGNRRRRSRMPIEVGALHGAAGPVFPGRCPRPRGHGGQSRRRHAEQPQRQCVQMGVLARARRWEPNGASTCGSRRGRRPRHSPIRSGGGSAARAPARGVQGEKGARLAIVRDLAEFYRGSPELTRSAFGGLPRELSCLS
jgi:hypothetical protein